VSIPNSDVANAVIDNFGVRGRRRQRFFVQVTYGTPPEKVEAFVDRIRRIITDHPLTDKDVSYIHFNNFWESGLTRILELAKEIGVEFAFPTRTLHVEDASGLPGSTGYRGPATTSNGS
jgi:MscS family membrane protein